MNSIYLFPESFFNRKRPYGLPRRSRGPSKPLRTPTMSPLTTQDQQSREQSRQPSTASSTAAPDSEASRGTKRNWRGYVQLEPAAYTEQVHRANSYFDVDTSLDSRRSKRARLSHDEQEISTPATQSSRVSSSVPASGNDVSEADETPRTMLDMIPEMIEQKWAEVRQSRMMLAALEKSTSAPEDSTARRKETAKRLSPIPELPAFDHARAAELIGTLPSSPSGTTQNERVIEDIERPRSAMGIIDQPDEPDLIALNAAEDLPEVPKLPHFDHTRAAELIETLPPSLPDTNHNKYFTKEIERPKSASGVIDVANRPNAPAPSAAKYLPKPTGLPQFDHVRAAELIRTLPLSPRGTMEAEHVMEEIERPKSAMGYIATEDIPLDASTAPPRPAADESIYSPDLLPLIVNDDDESMSESEASFVPKRKNFTWTQLRSIARAILAMDTPPPGFEDDRPTEDVSHPHYYPL